MNRSVVVAALLLLPAVAPRVAAHGMRHRVSRGATVVHAQYDDGSPMAFCDVSVFAPGEAREPYQEGTSDRNGCFAFLADTNGVWTVTVDDGMGHRMETTIRMDGSGTAPAPAPSTAGGGRLGRAVTGVSVLFGLFGLYAMGVGRLRRRPAPPSQDNAP